MLIGYARISTAGQNLDGQTDRLKEEGCERIFEEIATGSKSDRPPCAKPWITVAMATPLSA